jgi:hypothetical protein
MRFLCTPANHGSIGQDWRCSISGLGRTVVGQGLKIRSEQGIVGRWKHPVLAAIEFFGEQDDQLAISPSFLIRKGWPDTDP